MSGEQAPTASTDPAPSKEITPPPTGSMQPIVPVIPMIRTKREKGKDSRALKKSWKVVAAPDNA